MTEQRANHAYIEYGITPCNPSFEVQRQDADTQRKRRQTAQMLLIAVLFSCVTALGAWIAGKGIANVASEVVRAEQGGGL